MANNPSPADLSGYLESLMQAGQQSIREFDDALAASLRVEGKSSSPIDQTVSPFTFAIDMQRNYLTQFWQAWNAAVIRTISPGTIAKIQPVRGDKRFKDDAWQELLIMSFSSKAIC